MQDQVQSNIAGPGAIVEQSLDVKPSLEGATEFEYVEVLNPLLVDFAPQFATTTPVKAPVSIGQNTAGVTEADLRTAGLELRNPDYEGAGRSQAHIVSRVVIKAGQTKRFPGDKAQVVVRQLVTEILQREGRRLQMWDPHARHEVEQRVIRARGSIQEMLDGGEIRSVSEQVNEAFNKQEQEFAEVSNETTEPARPINQDAAGSGDSSDPTVLPERPATGRSKRTQ